jgi:hypothetical protein
VGQDVDVGILAELQHLVPQALGQEGDEVGVEGNVITHGRLSCGRIFGGCLGGIALRGGGVGGIRVRGIGGGHGIRLTEGIGSSFPRRGILRGRRRGLTGKQTYRQKAQTQQRDQPADREPAAYDLTTVHGYLQIKNMGKPMENPSSTHILS